MEEEFVPKKALYQLHVVNKVTEEVVINRLVVAYNEAEAISKTKVGSIIADCGLDSQGVELFIRVIGCLYEGIFDAVVNEKIQLTAEEITQRKKETRDLAKDIDKLKALLNVLEK